MNLFKLALWKKIIIGMLSGILVGSILGEYSTYLQPIGTLFVTAIQMLVVPLVFCALVTAMTAVTDLKKMGRIGGKSVVFYLVTSVVAVLIGIILANTLHPGLHVQLSAPLSTTVSQDVEATSIVDTLLNIVPSNPFNALASGNILQILFFAIILGLSINVVGKEGRALVPVFQAGAAVMYKLTASVMELAPYGVFALMASLTGSHGFYALISLLKLVLVIYLGYVLLACLVYMPIIWWVGGLSVQRFFKHAIDAIMVAFSTSSSSAALPVSMFCAEHKLGLSKIVARFLLPLGATVNMNGAALFQGVAALFLAQAYGIELTLSHTLMIVLTSVLAAIGAAGVPGAGPIMLSLVLNAVGLPLEGIGLIVAVDRIIDMGRSAFNVIGDLVTATVVAKSENELNIDIFNQDDGVELKGVEKIK